MEEAIEKLTETGIRKINKKRSKKTRSVKFVKTKNLHDLFIDHVKSAYWAEMSMTTRF